MSGSDQRQESATAPSLDGWSIGRAAEAEWMPWGSRGDARAKMLASADGYMVVLVEAQPGYRGDPHQHTHTEFGVILDGSVRNQGQAMSAGDTAAAATGSWHTDFEAPDGATYISIFKV
jgi:quercetin dioxygenase-like cupin family protein